METAEALFKSIEEGYLDNPYHNSQHGGDVTHNLLYFIKHSSIISHITNEELFSALLAALSHDLGHPGVTNRYLI
jgi:hypothetical protein